MHRYVFRYFLEIYETHVLITLPLWFYGFQVHITENVRHVQNRFLLSIFLTLKEQTTKLIYAKMVEVDLCLYLQYV